jgi:uncharacterized protein (TIRG00374 family)
MKHLRDPRVWLGLGVTVVCVWLALRDVSFGDVARDMAKARWGLLLAVAVPANIAAIWVRALRWRHLTDPIHPISTGPLFRATAVGFMANNVIPLRVGEVLRAWYLGREVGVSGAALFGTVILERVIDSAVFLALVGVIVGVYGMRLGGGGIALGVPLLLLLSAPMVFVGALRLWPEPLIRLMTRVLGVVSEPLAARVGDAARSFAEGLGAISRGGHLFWIFFHTVVLWLVVTVIPFWVGIVALGIDLGSIQRELAASYVLLTVVGIAVAIPSAPGFFGPYHLACRAALSRFGVPDAQALALGTLVHGVFWVTITLLGLIVLRVSHQSLQELDEHSEVQQLSE